MHNWYILWVTGFLILDEGRLKAQILWNVGQKDIFLLYTNEVHARSEQKPWKNLPKPTQKCFFPTVVFDGLMFHCFTFVAAPASSISVPTSISFSFNVDEIPSQSTNSDDDTHSNGVSPSSVITNTASVVRMHSVRWCHWHASKCIHVKLELNIPMLSWACMSQWNWMWDFFNMTIIEVWLHVKYHSVHHSVYDIAISRPDLKVSASQNCSTSGYMCFQWRGGKCLTLGTHCNYHQHTF